MTAHGAVAALKQKTIVRRHSRSSSHPMQLRSHRGTKWSRIRPANAANTHIVMMPHRTSLFPGEVLKVTQEKKMHKASRPRPRTLMCQGWGIYLSGSPAEII